MQVKYALEMHLLLNYISPMSLNKRITAETAIGEIIRAMPACSRVSENLNIDYCCGGKKSLAEACQEHGLEPSPTSAVYPASGFATLPLRVR
ncbi:MAG: DUF542 domain-containing protein [Limisphaerales bacterium]